MRRNAQKPYTTTQAGLADRIVDELTGRIAYNAKDKAWYWYNGKVWTQDTTGHVIDQVLFEVVRTVTEEDWGSWMYSDEGDRAKHVKVIQEKKTRFVERSEKFPEIKQALGLACNRMAAELDTADLLAFDNGVLPPSGEFREHRPGDYITTCIPTPYIPAAAESNFPPGEKFFEEISCGDPAWVESMFTLLGYCLLRGNRDQVFFVFKGSGANGKSALTSWIEKAFGNVVGHVLPRELQTNNRDQRQTTLANTVSRCRFILVDEKGGGTMDDDAVKPIVDGGHVALNKIQTGAAVYPVVGTLIMITNNLPKFSEGGIPMKRRQIAIPFDMDLPVSRQDPLLLNKLATPEGNAWLVAKVVTRMLSFLPTGERIRDHLCPRMEQFTDEAIFEQDDIARFIRENLVRDPEVKTPGADVFERYYREKYGDELELAERLNIRGLSTLRGNEAGEFYAGLKAHGIQMSPRCRRGKADGGGYARNVVIGWRLRTPADDETPGGQTRIS